MQRRFVPKSLSVLTCLVVLAACGGDDDSASNSPGDVAEAPTESAAPPSDETTGGTTGAASDAEAPTLEQLSQMASGIDVAGFEAGEPEIFGSTVQVPYVGDGIDAYVTLMPCDAFACWDLDGEVTAEHEQNLRSMLAPVHLENPDLVFDYGNVEPAAGYEAFYMYSFSFVKDGGSTASANSYTLIYHDGAKSMTIRVAPPLGPLPDTVEAAQAEMDAATAQAAASDVFAAYAPEFAPVS